MKNLRSILFSLTVLLMATAAQAQQTNVKANVPFDFVVGNHAYPAGDYSVKSLSENGTPILIDNDRESAKGIALSYTCTSAKASDTTKLVFHRLGDSYFLYQVWTQGNSAGREFPMSKTEVQLAQLQSKPELVIVAANINR
jgi:hypothetical protein